MFAIWTSPLRYWRCHITSVWLLCHYGGWWPSWLVAGRRGSKRESYSDCTVPGLTAEAHRLDFLIIAMVAMAGSDQLINKWRVITAVLLSVAASNTINDQHVPCSRCMGLQPCMFGCSAEHILSKLGCLFH